MLRQLVGSGWGAGAKTVRTAALSLVYSIVEYCAPVWCRSAHTCLMDNVLNHALRIVTGCLRPKSMKQLLILSSIQPVKLFRLGATLSLAHRESLDPNHFLYCLLSGTSDARQERLRLDVHLCQLREIFCTILPDLAPALLNGKTINGMQITVRTLLSSVFSCPGPVSGLLE